MLYLVYMGHYLHIRASIAFGFIFIFLANTIGSVPLVRADDFRLPASGVMVHLSPPLNPPILKGIKVHPDDPFRFDFILDKGDSQLSNNGLQEESRKLIKYFLASLTIPEKDLWVNLSPYEKDRIIPNSFGLTEMGRDLLAEDYMLKQITASLIYPEDEVGKKFWKRIYETAAKKYGTTNMLVNTFNKVWIVPEKAVVYENVKTGTAFVVESKLKVMLEQDYLSLEKHEGIQSKKMQTKDTNQLGSQVVREVVIPELTREVNENKNFAKLRQVYNSLILATWYKKKIKGSILMKAYSDKNKVAGVNINDPQEKEKIYQQYLKAFKSGVYNYIKEETDPLTQKIISRKYFSGGFGLNGISQLLQNATPTETISSIHSESKVVLIDCSMQTQQDNLIASMRMPLKTKTVSNKEGIVSNESDSKAMLTLQNYKDDISEAEKREEIIYTSKNKGGFEPDFYSYRKGIMIANTRPLFREGGRILSAIIKNAEQSGKKVNVLEVGAGVGRALFEMSQMGNINLDTVSLTPIAPHIFLKRSSEEVFGMIANKITEDNNLNIPSLNEYMNKEKDQHSEYKGKRMYEEMNRDEKIRYINDIKLSAIPFSVLFELQQHGFDIFGHLQEPYISHQFIGNFFDDEINFSGKEYNFIYDRYGGIYYSMLKNDHDRTLLKAASALSREGIIFLALETDWYDLYRTIERQDELVAIFLDSAAIIMRKDSETFKRIKANFDLENDSKYYNLEQNDKNVALLEKTVASIESPLAIMRSPNGLDKTGDSALLSDNPRINVQRESKRGGIDLTSANNVLQTQNAGEGIKFHLDLAQLAQLQNAQGLTVGSITIQPLKSLSGFLGLADNQSFQQVAPR